VRILYRAGFLVIAIFLILFAVSNRETVSVGFWPLPFLMDVPLYLLCFLSLVIGTLIGLATAGMAGHGKRRELRTRRRRIEALERELTATQSQIANHSERPKTQLPVTRQLRPLVKTESLNARQ
jgi:uncharacterized integral membrane protein